MLRFRLGDLSFIAQQVRNSYCALRMTQCPTQRIEIERSLKQYEAVMKQLQTKAKQDLKNLKQGKAVEEDFWS
jgi:hypothetical protein